MTKYNGWTNYATWRVNLEMVDGIDPRDMGWHKLDKYDLSDAIKVWCSEILEEQSRDGAATLLYSYAMAFMLDVNWREIADAMIEAYSDA